MAKLGIIGGLGPMATAYLFQKIIEMTDANKDQEHIEILIHNRPQIPDRTAYILGRSTENPLISMHEVGMELQKSCDLLAIPCVTAHYFYDELQEHLVIPVIHVAKETAHYLKDHGISKAAIMATDATVRMNILAKELNALGISCIYPDAEGQKNVMHLIYVNVKAGRPIEMERFQEVSRQLFSQGAEVIILGCTELSMIKRDEIIGAGYLDTTEVLARACVCKCGKLKPEYEEIISR